MLGGVCVCSRCADAQIAVHGRSWSECEATVAHLRVPVALAGLTLPVVVACTCRNPALVVSCTVGRVRSRVNRVGRCYQCTGQVGLGVKPLSPLSCARGSYIASLGLCRLCPLVD